MYHLVFQVSCDNSGKATYFAKRCGGKTHPYQELVSPNRCQQEIYYDNILAATEFISSAFEEFGTDFVIVNMCLLGKKGA